MSDGLDLAHRLIDAGVPVIVCRPRDGAGPGDGNDLIPMVAWRSITNAEQCRPLLKKYKPGVHTLAMIGGHGIDVVDVDTPHGSIANLAPFTFYGVTETPSGGQHYIVPSTGIGKIKGLATEAGPVGDYVGGTADHQSRMLAYLPGSSRPKYPGLTYRETVPWDIDACLAADPDPDLVAELVAAAPVQGAPAAVAVACDGPERGEDEGVHPYAARSIADELARLDELPRPWSPGDGWDDLTFKVACNLVEFANSPWTGYTLEQAEDDLMAHAPSDESWGPSDHQAKWHSAVATVAGDCRRYPGEAPGAGADFTPLHTLDEDLYDETSLADAHLGERVGREYLRGRFIAWGRNRWARWDGKRWDLWATETSVLDTVRRSLLSIRDLEVKRADKRRDKTLKKADESGDQTLAVQAMADHSARMKKLEGLLSGGKIAAVMKLARGVVEQSLESFDGVRTHHLLNVGNGVVNLRTGELGEHDPALLFTQVTEVAYDPTAEHPDWKKALTALPEDVVDWMQLRFGQAATGKATADDIVPFLKGGGANGKTTVLLGVKQALGDFAKPVPEKVILANPSDHPTELFSLKGVRLALIEELPDGDYLNVSRLKRVVGTETGMSARAIGQDNVQWEPTHSLMVTTNYEVQISEVDYGTWRRLAAVEFPYTFDGSDADHPKDDTLRDRLRDGEDGQHAAVLAWVVQGARRFYRDGMERDRDMPRRVRDDTRAWQFRANQAAQFLDEVLELAPGCAVRSAEVHKVFTAWIQSKGNRKLSDQTFWNRAGEHEWFRTGDVSRGYVRVGDLTVQTLPGSGEVKKTERLLIGARFKDDFDPLNY